MTQSEEKEKRFSGKGRTGSRELLVQALYQYQLNADDFKSLLKQAKILKEYKRIDKEYFRFLLENIMKNTNQLSDYLIPFLDRKIKQIDPIEMGILWIGSYEILYCEDVPKSVIMNEAIELAKTFGADGSFQYINAILDAVTKDKAKS
jgi:N utilization substance protein B